MANITVIIHTDKPFPPIPTRQFDWKAWVGDAGLDTAYGWGESEMAAIKDLFENHAEALALEAYNSIVRER